jgi:hypothetical protein
MSFDGVGRGRHEAHYEGLVHLAHPPFDGHGCEEKASAVATTFVGTQLDRCAAAVESQVDASTTGVPHVKPLADMRMRMGSSTAQEILAAIA